VDRIVETLLQKIRSADPKTDSPLVAKLIGEPQLISAAKNSLKDHGIPIEKSIERTDSFEIQLNIQQGKIRLARSIADPATEAISRPPRSILAPTSRIRVLILDDSLTVRKILCTLITEDPSFEVIGLAESDSDLKNLLSRGPKPDVITLDLNLPEKPGLQILKDTLVPLKIPAVIVSTLSVEDGPTVLSALEAGAVDYVQKPSLAEIPQVKESLLERLRSAAKANVFETHAQPSAIQKKATAFDRVRRKFGIQSKNPEKQDVGRSDKKLIAIGASTGGTDAIRRILLGLPEEIPPIVIVQHIPGGFSKAFADRLNACLPFAVREAVDGDLIEPGVVLIAPGGYHLRVIEKEGKLIARIDDAPAVNRHKPSVDVLFRSVAALKSCERLGLILTGMGNDGAAGLLELHQSGAYTAAQDEASCVVYGMPKEAVRLGGVERVAALGAFPGLILQWAENPHFQKRKAA
jgi:two-component system chemotaxis response regulator CheB